MSFDPTLINFLTVGNFASNPSYDVPASQQLLTAAGTGLFFQNAGAGSTYTLNTSGNLANVMTLQSGMSYGIVISVPQVAGGLITRTLGSSSTINITRGDGIAGNPSIDVVPSSSLQLTQIKVNGSNAGAAHSSFNLVAGSGIGLGYVDTGTQTNLTISSSATSGPSLADPFVIYTAASELTGAQNIGLLTTGLLKNTVASGIGTLSTAVSGTDYLLPNAQLAEFAALSPVNGDLLYYSGGAWTLLAPSSTTGQVLTTVSSTAVGWSSAPVDVAMWSQYPATQNVNFAGFRGINVEDPATAQQIATKNYVDLHAGGAPVGATYLTASANSSLTNDVNLGLLATGLVLSTVASSVATITTVPEATFGIIAGTNVWSGTNTFNTNLPTSTLTPTTSTQLVTKAYTDGTFGALAGTNAWSGSNTFNTNLPTSTLTPTTSTQLITKAYGDATYSTLTGAALLAGANVYTGTNVFNTNLPTSTLTPTSGTQLITKTYGDGTYGLIAGTNAWTGTNTFNTALPTSTQTPTTSGQLVTKGFTDTTYGALAVANIWSGGANTFNANPLFPTGATVSYVATCTNASTGAWTWQSIPGGPATATVTTTDATPTTLVSITPTTNSVTTVYGYVSGANAAHSDACGGEFSATFLNNAGTLTLVNTQFVLVNSSSTATYNVIQSGSNIIVQVTGIAATTYNWKAEFGSVVN